jgi:hypothetical protein
MKSTVCFLTIALLAVMVSCTPYRQESGKPPGPSGTSGVLPPTQGAGNSVLPEPPSITPQGGNATPQGGNATPPPADYPYAEKTSTAGLVLSPYPPYNVMDVRGLRSGQLALDPSCQKKFRVP